jgi:ABC-type glycerol-3-phosphate transport system permease component
MRRRSFGEWWYRTGRYLASYTLLTLFAATTLAPFLWMVLASFKPLAEVERLNPLPSRWQPQNYVEVFRQIAFARYYFNSLFVAAWVTFLQVLTSAMAGYAFSRLRWPGRDRVFQLYLATLMVPGVVTMIPNYTLMLRQFMLTIPTSIDEAAAIDGASYWQIFWEVILPLARPGLITLAIFTFMGNYSSFFWPLILIKSDHLRTLPIGMLYFDTVYGRQTNLIMAASVMNIIPLVLLFVVSQRFLVRGIQLGAVKG